MACGGYASTLSCTKRECQVCTFCSARVVRPARIGLPDRLSGTIASTYKPRNRSASVARSGVVLPRSYKQRFAVDERPESRFDVAV
jgi:hypothetical protein